MSKIRDCKEEAKELLVNMGLGGATKDEIEKAIQYSIDVLDTNKSYEEHGIAELEAKYQKTDKNQSLKNPSMTPDEFTVELQKIWLRYGNDIEGSHVEMDKLMCNLLVSLGYTDGVEFFNSCNKWYA